VWGFNGTERPGAVYLAAVLAGHTQKGIPAFSIYGHDVQDAATNPFPPTCGKKFCASPRRTCGRVECAANRISAWAASRWASPVPSWTQPFFEDYLGMRVETIDMTEFLRRMDKGIYDHAGYKKSFEVDERKLSGRKKITTRPRRSVRARNSTANGKSPSRCRSSPATLMVGNPKLAEMGFGEEAQGHNAIASGFQGQRQWTDTSPTAIFLEAILNSPSTGTASVRLTSSRRKTIASTALRCCSVIC